MITVEIASKKGKCFLRSETSDGLLVALDKFLRKSRMDITDIQTIQMKEAPLEGDISIRIAEATLGALEFGIRCRTSPAIHENRR